MPAELSLTETICMKHPRKVARDNTVKYHWRVLQLLPGMDRPSYAGLRVVVDEFGIWPHDRESATAFFTLESARYERGSIILTSNKGFGEWGELLGDAVIASAVLDRLLHHSRVLNIRGRASGSGRNARRGCSRHSNISLLRRKGPATTTPTDGIAGQRHYKWLISNPSLTFPNHPVLLSCQPSLIRCHKVVAVLPQGPKGLPAHAVASSESSLINSRCNTS